MSTMFTPQTLSPLSYAIKTLLLSSCCLYTMNVVAAETKTAQELPVIQVVAQNDNVSEGTNSYTVKNSNTSTKLNLSLRETPQTVEVFTREYLDDRNIKSFQELLQNITGVSISRTDERLSAYARGFQVDYYLIDGLPTTLTLAEGDPDLSIYDRVEVVKGANGLMTGAGNPAMGLNMIRKHANSKEFTGAVTGSAGSWDNYASTADLSAPLNADGSLRGRLFVKNSQENSFMDFYNKERRIAYGVIDYDISDKTKLSVGANYQELNRNGIRWGGLPAFYTDGTRTNFSRSTIVSSDWTYWDTTSKEFFANLKQNIFNDIDLNVAYTYRRDDVDAQLLYTTGRVNKATNTSALKDVSAYSSHKRTDENNLDIYLSAPFEIANRTQEIILGGSWNQNELKESIYGGSFYTGKNVLNVNALNYDNMNTQLVIPLTMNLKGDLNKTTQSAGYISGKFHILDPLKVVTGVRLSNWKYEDGKADRKFNDELTPYAGIVFDLNQNYSWYASYTNIFKPQSRKDVNNRYLDPSIGKSYETGVKGEFFDGRLNAGLGIYRIEQDNVADLLLDAQGNNVKIKDSNGRPTADNAYHSIDGVTAKGVELNIDGEINDNWGLSFGAASFSAKDAKGVDVLTTSSRQTADLFLKYKRDAWSAGAGINYYSKIYSGTGVNRIDRGDLYLASAMLGYKFDQNFSAQFNVNNIFDKKYYEGIASANSMNWGAPRNAAITLKYQF